MNVQGMIVSMMQIRKAWLELRGYAMPEHLAHAAAAAELIEVYGKAQFRQAAGLPRKN